MPFSPRPVGARHSLPVPVRLGNQHQARPYAVGRIYEVLAPSCTCSDDVVRCRTAALTWNLSRGAFLTLSLFYADNTSPVGSGQHRFWIVILGCDLNTSNPQAALTAKIETLTAEYDRLRMASSDLPFWNALLWEDDKVTRADWFLIDAWYRSRNLELPDLGACMVPVLDLANHSSNPNAYYDEDDNDQSAGVQLLLRPGVSISAGEEVTISYGEGKSGAEMLFSYGFLDPTRSTDNVTLPLKPLDDDPLGMAKVHIFDGPRTVQLGRTTGSDVTWESPFAWLLCLNEEDGLAFRVLQDTGGNRELRVLWQDEDVTGRIDALEELARSHPLYDVFRLRVVTVVAERVSSQLERVRTEFFPSDDEDSTEASALEREGIRAECIAVANALKEQEASVLEEAARSLEEQVRFVVRFIPAIPTGLTTYIVYFVYLVYFRISWAISLPSVTSRRRQGFPSGIPWRSFFLRKY